MYAEVRARRVLQIVADVTVVLWAWLWWGLAGRAREVIAALAVPGRIVARSGDDIAEGFDGVATAVEGVPIVGAALAGPFGELGGAATDIGEAGRAEVTAVLDLATWTGRIVFVVPVVLALLLWATAWLRAARRSGAAARLRDAGDTDALALRALTSRSARQLRRVSATPGRDWRRGDVDDLAAAELLGCGLEPRAGSAAAGV